MGLFSFLRGGVGPSHRMMAALEQVKSSPLEDEKCRLVFASTATTRTFDLLYANVAKVLPSELGPELQASRRSAAQLIARAALGHYVSDRLDDASLEYFDQPYFKSLKVKWNTLLIDVEMQGQNAAITRGATFVEYPRGK